MVAFNNYIVIIALRALMTAKFSNVENLDLYFSVIVNADLKLKENAEEIL